MTKKRALDRGPKATAPPNPAESDIPSDMLVRLGVRVRTARKGIGMSRRVLSEKSGVSTRYLAQLEAGEGNISIVLLQSISQALDLRLEWLVSQDDAWRGDAVQVGELYRNAAAKTQDEVQRLLRAETLQADRQNRICLIGLRGAGKSTLGRMAAENLDVPFVELNNEIARYAGMPTDEIIALYGPDGYRRMESAALDHVLRSQSRLILAVAGGVVTDPEVYDMVLQKCHTIWISARPEEHMSRVRAQGDVRPMSGRTDAMVQLEKILDRRTPLYARADQRLDTSDRPVERSLADLVDLIAANRFLAD